MRPLVVALFVGLAAFVTLGSASIAEDTAKQAAKEAKQELTAALEEHRKLSREAVLLTQQLRDLKARQQTVKRRLSKAQEDL